MLTLRPAAQRGRTETGWLDSRHTFSFGQYRDPAHMGFRNLRVINEDRVAPAGGFGTHPHADMEIISYVLEGELAHRDSMGNGSVIRPGEIQRMTAGTGVHHSEMNPSRTAPVHFLQMWVLPEAAGLTPGYEQRPLPPVTHAAQLDLIGSRDGRDGAVRIHQDVNLYRASLRDGATLTLPIGAGRHAWLQVARGSVRVGDQTLAAGDGAAISDAASITLAGAPTAELVVFDLA